MPNREGTGKPVLELSSMVGDFENVTRVEDWPGSEKETQIYFDEFMGRSALDYIEEHGFSIRVIHMGSVNVAPSDD